MNKTTNVKAPRVTLRPDGFAEWPADGTTPRPWVFDELGGGDPWRTSGGVIAYLPDGVYQKGKRAGEAKPLRPRVVIGMEPEGACGDEACCPQGDHLVLSEQNAKLLVRAVNGYDAALALAARAEAFARGEITADEAVRELRAAAERFREEATE